MAGAFVLGEVAASEKTVVTIVFILCLILFTGIYMYIRRNDKKCIQKLFFCLLFLTFMLAGAFRMCYEIMPRKLDIVYEELISGKVHLCGEIKSLHLENENLRMTLNNSSINSGEKTYKAGRIIVYMKKTNTSSGDLMPGMTVNIYGNIETVTQAVNPGEFNYRLYYKSLGITYRFWGDSVEIINSEVSPLSLLIYNMRKGISDILCDITESQDTGIFLASMVGDKTELSDKLFDMYERNGIAHLLAISGLHISIIGMGLYRILRKAGSGYALSGIIVGTWLLFYAMLTGTSASVVRAVFMLMCHFYADYLGRTYDLLSALSLSAMFLLINRPFLLWQGGFQLAYTALLAVGILVPVAEQMIKPQHALMKGLVVSCSIQLMTAPIILYHFFSYPVYAVILNIIVIPLMTYVICSGIAGVILGIFWKKAAFFSIGAGHYILLLYYELCKCFEKLPFYSINIGRPKLWQICIYYLILSIIFLTAKKMNKKVFTAILIFSVYPGLILMCHLPQPSVFEVTFLSVGQGDGIYMQYNGVNMLADCGSSSQKEIGRYTLEPFLKSRGITSLDYVWISHADIDHMNGVSYLLEAGTVRIKNLILPVCAYDDNDYEDIKRQCEKMDGKVLYMRNEDSIDIGKLKIACIYPVDNDIACEYGIDYADRNAQSQVLYITYGNFDMLLTGDIESAGEKYLVSDPSWLHKRDIEVLKAAHHGSKYSSTDKFMELVSPMYTVLSYGDNNHYGHPAAETVERIKKTGSIIKRTALSGAICFKTDGKYIHCSEFLISY